MTKPAMAGPLAAVLLAAAGLAVSQARAEPRALQAMSAAAEELSRARAIQTGPASWYGPGFHGRPTASGEPFNTNQLTAAHRTLPFGTRIKVVHQQTRRSVVVRINDRGSGEAAGGQSSFSATVAIGDVNGNGFDELSLVRNSPIQTRIHYSV
jgi:rare lipoprotein A